jgi:hypothetical protein
VPISSGGEMHIPAGDQLQTIGTDIKKLSGAGIRSKVQEHQHFRSWLNEGA